MQKFSNQDSLCPPRCTLANQHAVPYITTLELYWTQHGILPTHRRLYLLQCEPLHLRWGLSIHLCQSTQQSTQKICHSFGASQSIPAHTPSRQLALSAAKLYSSMAKHGLCATKHTSTMRLHWAKTVVHKWLQKSFTCTTVVITGHI